MDEIKHANNSFSILNAVLDYEKKGTVMDIYHIFVPDKMRSNGVAEMLAEAAFKFARIEGLKVKPTCAYIRNVYLKKHPEMTFLIEK